MLIGISGSLCSGKNEVANYLGHLGFTRIYLGSETGILSPSVSAEDLGLNEAESESRQKAKKDLVFSKIDELLQYVTSRWMDKFVLGGIPDVDTLNALAHRPFFLHIAVEAPITLRWRRMREKTGSQVSLEDFVRQSDEHLYEHGLAAVMSRAKLTVVNNCESLEMLYVKLGSLNLEDQSRLRPSWDTYFMHLANLASLRSNCMKRQVGCVLIRDKRVVATGYNGTPRGLVNCNEGGCPRCNSGNGSGAALGTCLCLHAEENALLEAGRDRVGNGAILYCNTCPCLTCSIKITQCGIKEVVYNQSYSMDEHTAMVFKRGGVILRQYSPPSQGLVG